MVAPGTADEEEMSETQPLAQSNFEVSSSGGAESSGRMLVMSFYYFYKRSSVPSIYNLDAINGNAESPRPSSPAHFSCPRLTQMNRLLGYRLLLGHCSKAGPLPPKPDQGRPDPIKLFFRVLGCSGRKFTNRATLFGNSL